MIAPFLFLLAMTGLLVALAVSFLFAAIVTASIAAVHGDSFIGALVECWNY